MKLSRKRSGSRRHTPIHAARPDIAHVVLYAFVLNTQGVLSLESDETDRALELFQTSAGLYRKLVARVPGSNNYRQAFARALANSGTALRVKGYLERAGETLAEAQTMREDLIRDHPDVGEYLIDACRGQLQTGRVYQSRSEPGTAEGWYTKAIDRLVKNAGLLKQGAQGGVLFGDLYRARSPPAANAATIATRSKIWMPC